MIYLDTQMLCDQGQTEVNKQYPLPVTDEMKEAEMEWFRKELENVKNSDYILVVGHYQVHTPNAPLKCLKPVDELLHEYNVTGYINGHIHNQFYSTSVKGGMHYLETGMGALTSAIPFLKPYRNKEINVEYIFNGVHDGSGKFLGWKGGFGMVDVDEKELTFEWWQATNDWPEMQHSVKIPIRNKL